MQDPFSTAPVTRRVLIGQYDSPYVRRVAIALQIYGIEYEQRPWSVMRDAAKIAQYNPLRRVPTLILPDGQILLESHLILDALDEEVSDDVVLLPRRGPVRRRGLQICGLSLGLADKAVSLIYDGLFRDEGAPRQRWNRALRSAGDGYGLAVGTGPCGRQRRMAARCRPEPRRHRARGRLAAHRARRTAGLCRA